jgi:hypothetical protein
MSPEDRTDPIQGPREPACGYSGEAGPRCSSSAGCSHRLFALGFNDYALDRPVSRRSRYLLDMGDELRDISPEPDGLDDLAERIAGRVAAILTGPRSLDATQNEWLTAGQLAARLGVTAQWVYDHQNELGAVKLGSGRKPRLRFPADTTPGTERGPRHRPRPEGNREPRTARAGLLPVYDD